VNTAPPTVDAVAAIRSNVPNWTSTDPRQVGLFERVREAEIERRIAAMQGAKNR
jgi:hypothetical protein